MVYKLERKILRFLQIFLILILISFCTGFLVYIISKDKDTNVLERKAPVYIDYNNSFDITSDNGYVIVGSNNHNNNNLEKAKISLYDYSREKKLERVYNKGYSSVYNDVINDNGNFIAVGNYESSKDDMENKTRVALIVKYDKNGESVFETDFQVKSNSNYQAITSVEDGYIVCGSSINNNSEGATSGAVIVKYNKEGKELWRYYAGSINAKYMDIISVGDNIYVVGVDNNIGILSIYDKNGNLIKNIYYENIADSGLSSINYFNNNIYISGTKMDSENTCGIIIKYDLNGNYINEIINRKYPNINYNKLTIDDDGNIIVVGKTDNSNEKITDGIISKYNNNLKELNVVKYSTDRNIYFNDILIVDNKYVLLGNSKISKNGVNSKMYLFSASLKSLGV